MRVVSIDAKDESSTYIAMLLLTRDTSPAQRPFFEFHLRIHVEDIDETGDVVGCFQNLHSQLTLASETSVLPHLEILTITFLDVLGGGAAHRM